MTDEGKKKLDPNFFFGKGTSSPLRHGQALENLPDAYGLAASRKGSFLRPLVRQFPGLKEA